MVQDSMAFGHPEQRRHRRFSLPSRVHLAVLVATMEAGAAATTTIFASLMVQAPVGVTLQDLTFVGLLVGAVYGALSLPIAQRVLALPPRGPHVPSAVLLALLASFSALILAVLAASVFRGSNLALDWRHICISVVVLLPLRGLLHATLRSMMYSGRLQMERVALVGSAKNLRRMQQDAPVWRRGAQPIAMFSPSMRDDREMTGARVEGFVRSSIERGCETVLLVGGLEEFSMAERVVAACSQYSVNVAFVPLLEERSAIPQLVDVLPYGPMNAVRVFGQPIGDLGRLTKRAFDLGGAAAALLFLLPLMLAAALAIKLTSPGPVLYRQERLGFNGRTFWILKFRSMSVMEDGRAMNPARQGDPRITSLGAILRQTSFDELPQLINVLRGEMSLVGPRPHAVSHDAEMESRFGLYARRRRIKPGITGWAQVNGLRGDASTQSSIEARTLHDLYYVENWSLVLDIWILLLTVFSPKARLNAR